MAAQSSRTRARNSPAARKAEKETVDGKSGLFTVMPGGDCPELDIVFVHGLGGHLKKTWTWKPEPPRRKWRHWLFPFYAPAPNNDTETSECFWPEDLLSQDFPKARILTYGYDSKPSHFQREAANFSNVRDLGQDLLQQLCSLRRDCTTRPLLVVVHSLGGLVVKSVSPQTLFFFEVTSTVLERLIDLIPLVLRSSRDAWRCQSGLSKHIRLNLCNSFLRNPSSRLRMVSTWPTG